MKVRIYKPSKTAMQSARGKTGQWVLEYEANNDRTPEPLMGWVSGDDTLSQVRLCFDSTDDAVAYAENRGWDYEIQPTHDRKIVPRNYGDNFVYQAGKKG